MLLQQNNRGKAITKGEDWWGSEGVPICVFSKTPTCIEKKDRRRGTLNMETLIWLHKHDCLNSQGQDVLADEQTNTKKTKGDTNDGR